MFSRPLAIYDNISWLPAGSSIELFRGGTLPDRALITTTHILCFSALDMLMVKHEERGWDVPGGHLEPGEDVKMALDRELLEEGSATAKNVELFTILKLNVPNAPKDYKYPHPVAYICCFIGQVAELMEFTPKFETLDRRLFSPADVRTSKWYTRNAELYELALEEARHFI